MKEYVIMGDVIKSSSIESEYLIKYFKKVINTVNKKYKKSILSPLTITLGDEFQGIVKNIHTAIELIFEIDKQILGQINYSLRYVINHGEVETTINTKSAHAMLGTGLTNARKSLENIKTKNGNVYISGLENGDKEQKLNYAFSLYKSLYNDIKEKDRMLAYNFLLNKDYKAIAWEYHKDDSSVWRKRKSLKIEELQTSKKLIKLIANE